MTGQRGLNGNLGCLLVADFADHHHIGILTQNGAQLIGKRQIDFWIYLRLVDSLKLVFHRVFASDDFDVRRVDFGKRRIECSRFSGTGRAGDKNNPVTVMDEFANFSQRFPFQPHVIK